jgi:hypothetical protein
VVDRIDLDRIRVLHRGAHRAQLRVDGMRQRVHNGRLGLPGNHQTPLPTGLQIGRYRVDPAARYVLRKPDRRHPRLHAEATGKRPGERLDRARPPGEAVVGDTTQKGPGALDGVQPT